MKQIVLTSDKPNSRLDKLLVELLKDQNLSRSYIQKLIKEKNVIVDDQIVDANNFIVKTNSKIIINIADAQVTDIIAQKIDLDIVYQDDDLLVINKQNNIVVHPGAGNFDKTIVNALLGNNIKLSSINGTLRPGIVHRIDKQTTGLLIVAKTDLAHKRLTEMLANHQIYKEYYALVWGVIAENKAVINAPIGRDQYDRKKMAVTSKNSKIAKTNFEVIERFKNATLVKCDIETGRTHQIRVHFNFIKHPILNDPVYGRLSESQTAFGQYLHASKLKFQHPITNQTIELIADLPKEFNDKIKELRGDMSE
ncbi:RluA family pseudouridine synthase [Mycoplasma putrefaciens]|uniref:Pseudouridine synthase n=1 Tax=Mycoplasma putrefaciens (strain ATCC 15718 / NCTC 10155 / C30 KS-1 / KS-1) TaxID=743965 RepID=A0A7U3ZSV7_MYCPK|nr:RluA family pseudouridine synthase [Mycoplasma putrefaciens]AEM68858.1 pseudouridine synthase, RluA family protein [Mycoplasma putrefaciens KS1]